MIRLFMIVAIIIIAVGSLKSQTGTLQIYCEPDVNIYIDGKYKGKTIEDMSGLLIENLPAKEIVVKTFKEGFISEVKNVIINVGQITEISFDLKKEEFSQEISAGLSAHLGAFGLFNVNDVFTKSEYSIGFTPYVDFKVHKNFAFGFEFITMYGKPETNDDLRLIFCANPRFIMLFSPLQKVHFNILIVGGLTYWPENNKVAYLTPTLNDNRFGWTFRANAGVDYLFSERIALRIGFGYWASSSTSDDVVWITHDALLISVGPQLKF